MKKTQIYYTDGKESICVIDDCFGESPLALVAALKRQDKSDGTIGGKYYIVRK